MKPWMSGRARVPRGTGGATEGKEGISSAGERRSRHAAARWEGRRGLERQGEKAAWNRRRRDGRERGDRGMESTGERGEEAGAHGISNEGGGELGGGLTVTYG